MFNSVEKLIRQVYQRWKRSCSNADALHPGEDDLACLFEGLLPPDEAERIKEHMLSCEPCAEAFALSLSAEALESKEVPKELLASVRGILYLKTQGPVPEIILRIKQNMLEIINVAGDILLGRELVPASVLRSRNIRDFKDELTIFKDFKDISVEIKIENKAGKYFDAMIKARQKQGPLSFKDLRITLIKDDLELESYLSYTGSVNFEHILFGKYRLEITSFGNKLASVVLDIRI